VAAGLTGSGAAALDQPAAVKKPTPAYISAEYCKKCHRENEESKTDLCRLTEYHYWDNQDRHRIAWTVLKGARAQQIGALLRKGNQDDISRDPRCIACHAIDTSKTAPPPNELVARYKYTGAEGISCVECHGPALEWVVYHGLPTREWRTYPRDQKEREYGMFDLWNPVTRTKLCLSCHLGDRDKGRIVTHEMFAAGHPPLPGIEVATFSDEQPRHWLYLREKYLREIDLRKKDPTIPELLGFQPDRMERTELIAIDGILALVRSLELLAAQASTKGEDTAGPEYARYDCYSCHHELSSSGLLQRQTRETGRVPGRPRTPSWPGALASLGIVAANPDLAAAREMQLRDHMKSFHAALDSRPFGDPKRIVESIAQVVKWADPIIGELAEQTQPDQKNAAAQTRKKPFIGRSVAVAMLHRLCKIAGARIPDIDSARQMAWACRTTYDEITPQPAQNDPIVSQLNLLDRRLALTLHRHATSRDPFPTKSEQRPIIDGESFRQRYKAVSEYDPSVVQSCFAAIAKQLPKR
jgi:hypothetical protein